MRNLKDLVATMSASTSNPQESLQTFLDDLMLDSTREEEEEKIGDAVTLITVHSCKGLEFPHVHIVGLEDGLMPHSRSKVEGTMDEERRLFYVAITRAMQTLTLSHCAARKKYGSMTPCHPSPFLNEVPSELIESSDEKSKTTCLPPNPAKTSLPPCAWPQEVEKLRLLLRTLYARLFCCSISHYPEIR